MNLLKLNYLLLLLCTNCLVVWADFEDSDVFVNRYIEDIDDSVAATFCAHDGFLNETCQCGTDYAGATCQTRQCRNFGVDGLSFLKTDRCLCPPGFLGRNCEPVRCVDGSKSIFQQSERTIALLATTNIHMNQSWTTDNPVNLFCTYTSYTRIFNLGGFMVKVDPNATTCNPKLIQDPCDNSECIPLELSTLYELVAASPPNTIVFVLSNQPIDTADEDVSQKIIATAIAKRIQINVVLYEMISDQQSLEILRNIATSTVGSFVKKGYESDSPGVDLQYQVIQNLLQNFDNGIHIAALGVDKNLPLQVTSDLYVSGQVDFGKSLTISTSNDQAVDIIVDTTYWKLYRLNASALTWIRVTGQTDGTTVLIQTKDRLRAYAAFTIDDGWVDAMFPTTIAGTSYPLALRFENDANVLEVSDVRLITTLSTSSTFNISSSIYTHVDCQFNIKLDSVCSSADVIFLYALSTTYKPALLPISCVDKKFGERVYNSFLTPSSIVGDSYAHQLFVKDAVCSAEPTVNKFGTHSFVIISPNSIDVNQSLSSIDNLYRNPNSVFYQLYKYLEKYNPDTQYSNFIGSLYGSDNIDTIKVENKYEYFVTAIMNTTNSAPFHTEDSPVDIVTHIYNTLENPNLKPFSDVFVIIDSPIKYDTEQAQMLKLIQTRRVRLFVIYVSTYSNVADSDYIFLNDIVSRSSGGLLTVVNDYAGVSSFFDTYMGYWVDNIMIANGYSSVPRAGIALSDVNLIKGVEYYLLVTNRDATSLSNGNVNVVVTATGGTLKVRSSTFGDIQQFLLAVSTTASFNIAISGFAQLTNVILLEKMDVKNYVDLTFVNDQNVLTNSIGYNLNGFQPLIYSSFNFTSTDSKLSITQLTDSNPFAVVGSIINQTSCDSFGNFEYSTNFNWVCSQAGGLYRVKIDLATSIGTYTRTFPLTCITSTASACLNDGSSDDSSGKCICALGWSGDVCQTPVCLNNGNQTPGNTCQCQLGFSGSHCETSSATCQNSPAAPAFRSDLSSLIIVAESNALRNVYLTSGVTVPGVPITVTKYKGSQADIVLTTNDGTLLSNVLNQNVDPDEILIESTAQDLNNALNVALNYQNTDRSLVVVLTSQNDFSVDPDTLIRLAARRSEIRFLTTSNAIDSLATLSLIGNSIPIFIQDYTGLQNFFGTYVAGVFERTKSQKVFNVYQTDVISVNGTLPIVIPADDTDSSTNNTIILHVFNGSWVPDSKNHTSFKNGLYNLYIFDNVAPAVEFSLTLQPATDNVKFYYSIERINYLSTAYGFSLPTDGSDEQLIVGARTAENNVLSIYTSPLPSTLPSSNPQQLPYLEIRQILNGNLDSPQTVLFTRKPSTCLYTHFTALDICKDSSVLGYQVRLNTRTSQRVTKQQQFTLTCHNTHYSNNVTSCGGYGSPYQVCDCDPGYTGIDCNEPICVNGVRDGSICRCPVSYYGKRCESQNEDYVSAQAVAFVLDIVGNDDFAYNETINTVKEYVKDSEQDSYVMIIANVEPLFQPFKIFDEKDLSVALDAYYLLRNPNATANLTDALTQIANSLNSLPQNVTISSKNIFYLTQTGLATNDDVASVLSSLSDFERSAVVYSPFNTFASSSIGTSLSPFTSNVQTVNNYYDATKYLISKTSSGKFTTPVDPNRSCAYGIQGNIIVALDVSKTDAANADDKKNEILSLLRNKFNYVNNDVDRCTANVDVPSFYNERTLFSIFTIYDTGFISGRFCPSNYDLASVANYAGSEATPEYTDKQLDRINSFVNNNANCSCSRTSNLNTAKFLIWMPRAYTQSLPARLASMTYTADNSAQFVIPFYDIDKNSTSDDLYFKLLEQNKLGTKTPTDYILPNAVNTDAQAIVDALENMMCKLANVPGSE